MESMKEFVDQFRFFRSTVQEAQITIDEENLITLFAIFRKDSRTEKINKTNNGSPATEKQKNFLRSLVKDKEPAFAPDIERLTKKEASDWITKLRGE